MFKKISIFVLKLLAAAVIICLGFSLGLYAAGFRYNFSAHKIVKVSLISVRSTPKGANVFLNDKPEGVTPAKIKNVIPGSYTLRVEKAGYETYQREVQVQEDIATEENYVELFQKERSQQVLAEDVSAYYLFNDKNTYLVLDNKEIRKESLQSGDKKTIYNIPDSATAPKELKLPFDEKSILAPPYLFVGNDYQDVVNINQIFGIDFEALDFVDDTLYLAGIKDGRLYLLDYMQKVKYPLSDNVENVTSFKKKVYFQTRDSGKISYYDTGASAPGGLYVDKIVYRNNLEGQDEQGEAVTFGGKIFAELRAGRLFFLSGNGMLIDITSSNSQLLAKNFTSGDFETLDWFLYLDGSEIRYYDAGKKKDNVVSRYSEEVRKALWHKDFHNAFFSLGKEIKTVDIDGMSELSLYSAKIKPLDFQVIFNGDQTSLLILDGTELSRVRVQ